MPSILALLARGPGLPDGSIQQGLEFQVGLTGQGQIDATAWFADPQPWPARRFRPGRRDWEGEVVLIDEENPDAGWALRGVQGTDDPVWTLDGRIFRPGEYVTLRRPNAEELIYRIVAVRQPEPPV